MSVQPKSRSFFSTTAGVVTGIAGVLTAVVGIIGAANQLGWIGSKDDKSVTTTTTPAPTQDTAIPGVGGVLTTTTSPGSRTAPGPTTANARFSVTPKEIDFSRLIPREAIVTVKNDGTSAIPFDVPTIGGASARNFTATAADSSCSRLEAGRSCQVRVTFEASGGGTYTANLVVKPTGGIAQEVALRASVLL